MTFISSSTSHQKWKHLCLDEGLLIFFDGWRDYNRLVFYTHLIYDNKGTKRNETKRKRIYILRERESKKEIVNIVKSRLHHHHHMLMKECNSNSRSPRNYYNNMWQKKLSPFLFHLLLLPMIATTTKTIHLTTALSTSSSSSVSPTKTSPSSSPSSSVVMAAAIVSTTTTPAATTATTTTTTPPDTRNQKTKKKKKQEARTFSKRRTTFPNSIPLNDDDNVDNDRDVFLRQTNQYNPSRAAIGKPSQGCICHCIHGYPQVFVMDPIYNGRINSGLLKLTCPLLVNAIDKLEDDNMIQTINNLLNNNNNNGDDDDKDESLLAKRLRSSMIDAHERHVQARKDMIISEQEDDDNLAEIRTKLGPKGYESFMNSGVAGASFVSGSSSTTTTTAPKEGTTKLLEELRSQQVPVDVKCLHAWYADSLFFDGQQQQQGGSNNGDDNAATISTIGDLIRQELTTNEKYNVNNVCGTLTCYEYCNPKLSVDLSNPPKPRNKQRLRTSKELERRRKSRNKNKKQQQQRKEDQVQQEQEHQ